MKNELFEWRKELHKIPETGLDLPQTSAFVQNKLTEMKISFQTMVGGSCVVALIGKTGACIMLRSDMDGLPIKEDSGEEFAADNGCMHACGHDLHTAALLGAAKILKKYENELAGQVKLVFQPGEEIFAGALAAIEEGVLENPKVDAAFSMHTISMVPRGFYAYGQKSHAGSYTFRLHLKGKGCHGATPHVGIDPINTGVHIYLGLQELIARESPSSEEAVLTVGHFAGGNVPNTIPDTVVMEGTIRTFNNELLDKLINRVEEVVQNICAAYRTEYQLEVLSKVKVLVCDQEICSIAAESAKQMGLVETLITNNKTTGCEDYAYFASKVPSGFLCYGSSVGALEECQPHHCLFAGCYSRLYQ